MWLSFDLFVNSYYIKVTINGSYAVNSKVRV